MPDITPLHELGKLPEDQLQNLMPITTQQMLTLFRQSVVDILHHAGFSRLPKDLTELGTPGAKRELRLTILTDSGHDARIIFAPAASDPIDLEALSSEECAYLERVHPQAEIYYASFFLTQDDHRVYMIGPVLLRRGGNWRTSTSGDHITQFLPPRLRAEQIMRSGASLLGGAELFKMEHMLVPHMARCGVQPRFSIRGLFSDRAQDNEALRALMDEGTLPTHFVLFRSERASGKGHSLFRRAFFYHSEQPENILTLRDDPYRQDSDVPGPILLQTANGFGLRADCLEVMTLPGALLTDSRYKWTLSLVATACGGDELYSVDGLVQPHLGSCVTSLRGRVLDATVQSVNGRMVGMWRLEVRIKEETLRVCAFVSRELWELESPPHRGDEVACNGLLYAVPDSFLGVASSEESQAPSAKSPRVAKRLPRLYTNASEAVACRSLGVALFTGEWDAFTALADENLSYTSAMNGTCLSGRDAFIRYMRERRALWEKQNGWAGMCMDTGTVQHKGKRRACAMISCYGRMVGAWVLSLSSGHVVSIETLPTELNATFEMDAACKMAPPFFHPMRGHITPHPALQTPLQHFAYVFLRECMRLRTGFRDQRPAGAPASVRGARWLKTTRNEPACCDFVFAVDDRVYAVCAVEVEKHPMEGGTPEEIVQAVQNREQLLTLAEKNHLIPCIFPVRRNMQIDPQNGWNLWDMRDLQPLSPDMPTAQESVTQTPSAWLVYLAAVEQLQKRIENMGGKLIAAHETPDLAPHVWFRDARGALSWVLLQIADQTSLPIPAISAEKGEEQPRGYTVTATPYGDPAGCSPARCQDPIFVQFSDFKQLG